jgi:hypothetical protein
MLLGTVLRGAQCVTEEVVATVSLIKKCTPGLQLR